jgi:hypothetical protein
MRAQPTDVTGNVGETEVSGKFERLGWGVAPNPKHDLGTDLWLMARDERLFDLGLVVGAQVKGGPSWFDEELRDSAGVLTGWWFRDASANHVDAWLAHGLPHVVVLYDLDKQIAYWSHVTDDSVTRTGKGAKIFVPVGNTVDKTHREDLLRVAASKKPGGAWEGSAWSGASAVAPAAMLRHALLVPRLIAPHPNAGLDAVSPAQAVALLVQARVADLDHRSESHDSVPSLDDAGSHKEWGWRFVGALGHRVTAGDYAELAGAALDAPDAPSRTAAAVAAAATLLEDGLADEALLILDAALEPDDAEPVDHAWLVVQKARACAEIGRVDDARDLAAQVQGVSATHANDVTATALAGVAARILFNTGSIGDRDLSVAIAGSDTAAAWWRTQTQSRGLTALTERTFLAWARDTTWRMSVGDAANDQLLSAALTASFAGDHATWRHLAGLLGQDGLLRLGRHAPAATAAEALQTLRFAGDADSIKHAVRRLADDGPAAAVRQAASAIDLDRLTATTAQASLTLLERGGDLLEGAVADATAEWLLKTLADPSDFARRTRPSYLLELRLVDTLAGVVPAATLAMQRKVAAHVTALPPQTDQARATSWARTALAVDDEAWAPDAAVRAGDAADTHHWSLRTPLLGIAAPHHPAAHGQLLALASDGDLDALGALGDVRALSQDIVRVLVEALSGHVALEIEQARRGHVGMGGHDYAEGLVVLNAWHPDLASWDPVVDLIANGARPHKLRPVLRLAALAERVPAVVREPLLAAVSAAAAQPAAPGPRMPGDRDITGPLAELAAALATEDTAPAATQLPPLLSGDRDARRSAARIATRLRTPQSIGVLVGLAWDDDPYVRGSAAWGLATSLTQAEADRTALAVLQLAADDPGRHVPESMAAALVAHDVVDRDLVALRHQAW